MVGAGCPAAPERRVHVFRKPWMAEVLTWVFHEAVGRALALLE